MKSLNYWQQFTHTGKVDDYLAYVSQEKKKQKDTGTKDRETVDHAGLYMCNRNDTEADSGRGI